jgi:hypothetical protein
VTLGQSIYNWGVYSNETNSKEDSFDLLGKLSKMLGSAGSATATTLQSISALRSDLQGETSKLLMKLIDFRLEIMKTTKEHDGGKKKTGTGAAGFSKSSSGAKVCLHCGDFRRKGQEIELLHCNCGKSFHHICAGLVGHESWRICFDCSKSTATSPTKQVRNEGKECPLEKALHALSEAYKTLQKASTAYQLCGRKDSVEKENEFITALDLAGDCVKTAWRAWSASEDGPSTLKDDTRSLFTSVLEAMKEIPESRARLRADMAFIKRNILGSKWSIYSILN